MDWILLWMLEHLMKDIYGGDQKPVQQGARGRYFGLCESLPCESSQRQFVMRECGCVLIKLYLQGFPWQAIG